MERHNVATADLQKKEYGRAGRVTCKENIQICYCIIYEFSRCPRPSIKLFKFLIPSIARGIVGTSSQDL